MGLHLYVPDEEDRGINWECTAHEMLEYASRAEPRLVVSPPCSLGFSHSDSDGLDCKKSPAWRLTCPECLCTTSLI